MKCPSCGTKLKTDTRNAVPTGIACLGALVLACYALGVRGVWLVVIPVALNLPLLAAVQFVSCALVGTRLVVDYDGTEFRITPKE